MSETAGVHNEVHYASPRVAMGNTRVPRASALWREWNQTAPVRVLTFPRRAFAVDPDGAESEVLHAGTAVLSRTSRPYRRRALDERGEDTDWLWIESEALERAIHAGGRWDPTQRWQYVMRGADVFEQRLLARRARFGADPGELEERAYLLAMRLFGFEPPDAARNLPGQRRAVRRVVECLLESLERPPALDTLAVAAGLTPSHLCVIFKRVTGVTIQQYANVLRLATALNQLQGRGPAARDLTQVALKVGFSSHSHLTARFRAHYGCTPSEARRRLSGP